MAHHAATVREAIGAVTHHEPDRTPNASIMRSIADAAIPPEACLRDFSHLPDAVQRRQYTEPVMGVAVQFLRSLTRVPTGVWRVHLRHGKGLTAAQYRRHLGCSLVLGQPDNALVFPADLLNLAVNAADPRMVETAKRIVANEMRRHPLDLASRRGPPAGEL